MVFFTSFFAFREPPDKVPVAENISAQTIGPNGVLSIHHSGVPSLNPINQNCAAMNGVAQTKTQSDSSVEQGIPCSNRWHPGGPSLSGRPWMEGIFGCMRPVLSLIGKSHMMDPQMRRTGDDWEIPFEIITDLEWLGSGAQGAVFSGKLRGEMVAVKKVRDVKETEIKHLRKLDHENIVKFKGVCTQSPVFCIIMEYCPYGPLHEIIKEDDIVPPIRFVTWAKQIAQGMQYLHQHKIIHRDLKSPNILIGKEEIVKISDFGTSREWNEISTKMSFAGTVAWMAPEVIRNEPCSEKVDIWSYGVVLWELMTCEVPYKDVDSSAIIWGVGNNSLHLPIPTTSPPGFKLLIELCWKPKPRNRPSFKIILNHLEIAGTELLEQSDITTEEYFERQKRWREEVRGHMLTMASNSSNIHKYEQDLIKKREDEWKHAKEVREIYENRLAMANQLFMKLEQREREIAEREKNLPGFKKQYKRIVNPIKNAHERHRRKCASQTQLPVSNLVTQDSTSTPSPLSPVAPVAVTSPKTSKLYAQIDSPSSVAPPKSVVITTNGSHRTKKLRHRRTGSGTGFYTPKSSPSRDRKTHSEPNDTKVLVSTETQTDAMDVSETDASSPVHGLPAKSTTTTGRRITMCLYEDESTQKTTIAYIKPINEAPTTEKDEVDKKLQENEEEEDRPATPSLMNGNVSMTNSGVSVYRDACSSPDLLNDLMNSNERLDTRECSDGDNLERLEKKVQEFITDKSRENGNSIDVQQKYSGKKRSFISVTESPDGAKNFSRSSSGRHSQSRLESHYHHKDEQCNDSWTDEEGEDTYDSYVLRRKSVARLPIRRRYKHSSSLIAVLKSSRQILMSDEENTSEYSHPPSSQHSTLESNPEVCLKQLKRMQERKRMRSKSVDDANRLNAMTSSSSVMISSQENECEHETSSASDSDDDDLDDGKNCKRDTLNGNGGMERKEEIVSY
ncbi:mitogen-activated protein kinase kinase kinase 13-B isoform X2 [Culicoides brevitarsis]|uniref:mitogen-activated protein kinase kinase kinase 13-B isoform X2 n=1 Tax=Culicoides brevitarsis TaxID=469753 RepID=UPI00307B477A